MASHSLGLKILQCRGFVLSENDFKSFLCVNKSFGPVGGSKVMLIEFSKFQE